MAAVLFVLGGCLGTMASILGLIFLNLSWTGALTTYAVVGLITLVLCFAIRFRPISAGEGSPQSA